MSWIRTVLLPVLALTLLLAAAPAKADQMRSVQDVLDRLNRGPTVAGRESAKSYQILFDAYLELSQPPIPIGPEFNLETIHPGMRNWDQVAGWAESNPRMAKAILDSKERSILGLPYGRDGVKQQYVGAGLIADIAPEGDLRLGTYSYLDAMDVVAAFVTAEAYRLMEAGQVDQGLDLAVAHLFVVRQICDREMFVEKSRSIAMLSIGLANLRDKFHKYRDKISHQKFTQIAVSEIPFLRPDRNALFMPEGDRLVAEALIRSVFQRDFPDDEKFASTFGMVQAADAPLTRFGATRRWERIAGWHGSLDASLERLRLIYDDWWRRWRVQEYDPILDIPAEFDRTNPVRYAAVIYSIRDLEQLFHMRRGLIVAVNGTALAAGLCGYHRYFGNYPAEHIMTYGQFVRRSTDVDPYDRRYWNMLYILTNARHSIDTPYGRLWVERDNGILYSRGQNHADDRAAQHTNDGIAGDIVVWPPIKALAREQGRLQ